MTLADQCHHLADVYIQAAATRGRAVATGDGESRAHRAEGEAWDRFLRASDQLAATGLIKLANEIRLHAVTAAHSASVDAQRTALAATKGAA